MAIITFNADDLGGFYDFRMKLRHEVDEVVSQNTQKRTVYDYGAQGWEFRCRWRYYETETYLAFIGRLLGYGRAAQFQLPLARFGGRALPAASAASTWFVDAALAAGAREMTIRASGFGDKIVGESFQFSNHDKIYHILTCSRVGASSNYEVTFSPGVWEAVSLSDRVFVGAGISPVVRFDRAAPGFRRQVDGWYTADLRFVEDATPVTP